MSLLILSRATAQYHDTGQDPASLRWLQIVTPHFRVIYPTDFGSEGVRYAQLLEQSFERLAPLYPGVTTRLPVIIHNHSMQSNGYVSWAPRRMELYPLPGQDNLPMDPALQLTIHETAHVLQLGSLAGKGLARVFRYLLGEQAVAIGTLQIPMWALEGDAVYAETAATLSGRGRSNSFIRGIKATSLQPGGAYSYDKVLAGSYRSYTPDHYQYGYLMMNHLRTTSPGAWDEAMRRVSAGWHINPVNSALKQVAGVTKRELYDEVTALMQEQWGRAGEGEAAEYTALSSPARRDYVSHFTPHRLPDGTIVSLRTSLRDPSRFVITGEGQERDVMTTGLIYPYLFSYSNGTLVWAELHPDIRWDNRDYSVIKKLDLGEGRVTTLTRRTRYTSPDLSPDGRVVVAVATTPEMRTSLVFIDAVSGELLMEVAPPDEAIIQRPAWSSDGREVTMVTLNSRGEGIRGYRPTGKRWVRHLEESITDIIQAKMHNDTLFFLAQGNGSDNIYRIGSNGVTERVTASRYGISGFTVSGSELLFSDYTPDGYIIAATGTSATAGSSGPGRHEIYPPTAPMPVSQSVKRDESQEVAEAGTGSLTPRPYPKMGHLFNLHSWFPFYADISELRTNPTAVTPGVTLMSQNHLSTLIGTAGYQYNYGDHYVRSGISWRGWHPVIDLQAAYGGEQQVVTENNAIDELPDRGGDLMLNLSIYDRLWFARGRFRQMVMPALYLSYRNRLTWLRDENRFANNIIHLTGRLYLSNTYRMAYRDINPRWGQVIDLRLTAAPWATTLYNRHSYARAILFFPGVLPNHSLTVRAGGENQAPGRIMLYGNSLPLPRGYKKEMTAERLFSASADYTLPLLYPDLAAGSLLYIKRIRGTLFYDYSVGKGILNRETRLFFPGSEEYSSAGGELLADLYLLRIPFEISAGVRFGYVTASERLFVEGVLSVNIFGTVLGRER